jgi:hypothetical protein
VNWSERGVFGRASEATAQIAHVEQLRSLHRCHLKDAPLERQLEGRELRVEPLPVRPEPRATRSLRGRTTRSPKPYPRRPRAGRDRSAGPCHDWQPRRCRSPSVKRPRPPVSMRDDAEVSAWQSGFMRRWPMVSAAAGNVRRASDRLAGSEAGSRSKHAATGGLRDLQSDNRSKPMICHRPGCRQKVKR